jgi:hypothetical protein
LDWEFSNFVSTHTEQTAGFQVVIFCENFWFLGC